ncbi:MAG: APC family permease [Candidatus Thermoplasmatota archaeon]|nr:APC family permease [Candidatus Thermoplasmatota archaeon]
MESVGNVDTKRRPRKIGLKKELGFYELLVIGVAGALGNGALFGTVQMVSGAGPGAIFGFVFGAFIYGLLTMTYVEMSKVYPEAGGPTRYTIYTHGRWTNLINSMADLLWYLFIPPIEVVAIISGLDYFYHGVFLTSAGFPTTTGVLVGTLLILTFVPINYFGIKEFGRTTNVMGIIKLIFYIAMVLGFIAFVANFSNLTAYGVLPYRAVSILGIMPLVMYDFGATRVIPDLAEETKHRGDIGKAMIFTVIIESLIYVGVGFAVVFGFHFASLGIKPGDFSALSSHLEGFNPFFVFAHQSGITWVFVAALVTGLLAPYVTGYIYLGSGTRVLFAIGRSGFISKSLKKIESKHAIPLIALIVFAIIGSIIVLVTAPDPTIYTFIDDASAAGYLGLVLNPIANMVTRRQGLVPKNLRVRGMPVIAPLAVGLSALIPFWAGWPSEPYAVLLMLIGTVVIGILSKVKIGARNVIWYVVFILFETIMVMIGSDGFTGKIFGASIGNLIPFTWATLIVLVVSMAIFYPWGILSGFKKQFSHPDFTQEVLESNRLAKKIDPLKSETESNQ